MKLKRNALVVLLFGFVILFIGAIMPLIYRKSYISKNEAIGVTGSADTPTLSSFGVLPFLLVLLGISLVVSSGFCLLFSKTVKTHCNINSSVISLGLSAVGAVGLACVFLWFTIVSFGEMSKYPTKYPVSVLLGSICFFVFIGLTVLYFKVRKMNWSIKGIIIDALTSIVYLPTFFFIFAYLYEMST